MKNNKITTSKYWKSIDELVQFLRQRIAAFKVPQHIDIALDTRIYNGHTTTIEMIQAGVPLVTLKGSHFASRVSSSILKNLELNDFITESYEEYESKIISLINKDECASAKNLIKQKINNPEIFSVRSFTKDFEQTLLKCFS